MSHREHAPGVAERGNDWLDGALAGWLLFIAINGGNLAWHSLREGAAWSTSALNLAVPVLAVAAIFPLLRFYRIGWALALVALGLMAVREGMMLAASEGAWRATAAFLLVDLLGMAYLLWIIPEFWPRHPDSEPVAASRTAAPAVVVAEGSQSDASATPGPSPDVGESPAPAASSASAEPTPVMHALAAIHHRMVAAGSACAVTEVAVRAEAGRFGVTPAALRTEGLTLYRTFLRHFMADGALSPDEERELICLERALDLDDDGVWKLRAEAGLVGGMAAAAPPLRRASDPTLPASPPALSPSASVDADPPIVTDEGRRVSADDDRLTSIDADRLASIDADRPISVDVDRPTSMDADRRTSEDVDRRTSEDVDRLTSVDVDRLISVDADRLASADADRLTSADADGLTSDDADGPSVDAVREDAPPAGEIDARPIAARTAEPETDGRTTPVAEPAIRMDGGVPEGTAAAKLDPSAQADITSSVPRFQSPRREAGHPAAGPPPHAIPADPAPSASASAGDPDALEDYEEHELSAALAWAGIGALPAGASRRTALERLRALHRTVTEPLEPCETDVALEPGESCLAQRDVQVYVAAAGAVPPPPDLPGPVLSRRALVDGSLERDRDLSALQRRGARRFVLTERRLLLVTPAGQRSELAVSRVRAVQPHRNGIEVRQQRGAPVFLAFSEGVGDAAMRMDRAAADLRARAG